MQDKGQIEESYSISAGLDFPSVGPQHAFLMPQAAPVMNPPPTMKPLKPFQQLARCMGLSRIESAHAIAYAVKWRASTQKPF